MLDASDSFPLWFAYTCTGHSCDMLLALAANTFLTDIELIRDALGLLTLGLAHEPW